MPKYMAYERNLQLNLDMVNHLKRQLLTKENAVKRVVRNLSRRFSAPSYDQSPHRPVNLQLGTPYC